MMHASLEDLLALKDGEHSEWVARHVEGCAECAAELERLHQVAAQLRALPVRRPPRDRWPAIRDRVLAGRRQRRWQRAGWGSLAAAASLLLALGLTLKLQQQGEGEAGAAQSVDLATLRQQSRQLEEMLSRYGTRGRVVSGRAASVIAELEDLLAVTDAQLSRAGDRRDSPREQMNLWRQRVGLLDALVNVRVTRAVNVGL